MECELKNMYKHFFTTPEIYEQLRTEIDQSQGFPNHIAITCIPPVDETFIDADGNCHLSVNVNYIIDKFENTPGVIELI